MSDPRRDTDREKRYEKSREAGRDPHLVEAGSVATDTGPDSGGGSATHHVDTSRREAMSARLMELSVWLSENPKAARKNLKPIRRGNPLEPGVYYNPGLRMIERLYRPQHAALGNKMLRISTDPAAPVEEIRRRVLEGKS